MNHKKIATLVALAANDLPDLFTTHSWATIRYGSFLADLSGRSWAKQMTDSMKGIVTDKAGKLYVLPFDSDVSGPVFNVDVLKQYGIAVPTAMDQFLAACETIKTKSKGAVTPITVSSCGWVEAQFFDFFATPYFISAKGSAYGDQLKADLKRIHLECPERGTRVVVSLPETFDKRGAGGV
jgi:raffinose/stachyose/melibiose transport system substrate-binding protein